MEDYSKYVCMNECDSDNYEFIFLDFNYDNIKLDGLNIYTEKGELTHSGVDVDVKQKIIEKIVDLSNKNFDSLEQDLKGKFTFIGDNLRKLYSTIMSANSLIAISGYIGPGNTILISEENYDKYDLKIICDSCKYNILFDDTIKDIFIYRKNTIEQPGLVLSYFENKYELIEIGHYPEKQFLKIVL